MRILFRATVNDDWSRYVLTNKLEHLKTIYWTTGRTVFVECAEADRAYLDTLIDLFEGAKTDSFGYTAIPD